MMPTVRVGTGAASDGVRENLEMFPDTFADFGLRVVRRNATVPVPISQWHAAIRHGDDAAHHEVIVQIQRAGMARVPQQP